MDNAKPAWLNADGAVGGLMDREFVFEERGSDGEIYGHVLYSFRLDDLLEWWTEDPDSLYFEMEQELKEEMIDSYWGIVEFRSQIDKNTQPVRKTADLYNSEVVWITFKIDALKKERDSEDDE